MSAAARIAEARPRRPPASPAERELVRRIARFIIDRGLEHESWLVAMVLVSKEFPEVKLDSVLCGYVFRNALAPEKGCCNDLSTR
jgi:hypothetical protein